MSSQHGPLYIYDILPLVYEEPEPCRFERLSRANEAMIREYRRLRDRERAAPPSTQMQLLRVDDDDFINEKKRKIRRNVGVLDDFIVIDDDDDDDDVEMPWTRPDDFRWRPPRDSDLRPIDAIHYRAARKRLTDDEIDKISDPRLKEKQVKDEIFLMLIEEVLPMGSGQEACDRAEALVNALTDGVDVKSYSAFIGDVERLRICVERSGVLVRRPGSTASAPLVSVQKRDMSKVKKKNKKK